MSKVLFLIVTGYLVLVLAAYLLQARLLYYPQKAQLQVVQSRAKAAGLTLWPSTSPYVALIGDPRKNEPDSPVRGTVLVSTETPDRPSTAPTTTVRWARSDTAF